MQRLVDGVQRFQTNVFSAQRHLFERLAEGQNPLALFITCSDSRINPNLITQTEPGELFILRNAGNIVPPYGASRGGEEGSIEYAVSVLGVEDIIVCGHSHCGAMSALLDPAPRAHVPEIYLFYGTYASSPQRHERTWAADPRDRIHPGYLPHTSPP